MAAAGQHQGKGAQGQVPPPTGQGQGQGHRQTPDLQAQAIAQGHKAAIHEAVDRIRALEQQLEDQGEDSILGVIDFTTAGAINPWSNSPSDTEMAEQWLEAVSTVKGIITWSENNQALKAMVFNLRGVARTWFTTKTNDVDGDPVDTLENFTKAFLDQFRMLKTPSEVISIMKELNALRSKLASADNSTGSGANCARATKATAASCTAPKMQGKKKSSKPFTVDPECVAKRCEWVYCHGCYTWGKHFQWECKATQQELRTLRQEHGREKPTGNTTDCYYR